MQRMSTTKGHHCCSAGSHLPDVHNGYHALVFKGGLSLYIPESSACNTLFMLTLLKLPLHIPLSRRFYLSFPLSRSQRKHGISSLDHWQPESASPHDGRQQYPHIIQAFGTSILEFQPMVILSASTRLLTDCMALCPVARHHLCMRECYMMPDTSLTLGLKCMTASLEEVAEVADCASFGNAYMSKPSCFLLGCSCLAEIKAPY